MKNSLPLLLMSIFGCLSFKIAAQGDLLVSPNRVVFEGRVQKAELNLINTGEEATTYSVSFVQRRMNEDGSFENIEVPDEGQMFASPYLRIYPRQVTLQPGEAQVVMVQFIRKPDMPAGEYRSHLYFRSEKNYTPLGKAPADTTRTLSVQLIPVFGMSIPIIIRSGEVNAIASLTDLKLRTEEDSYLSFVINREGNISIYGNISVEYIPKQGRPIEVGLVKGVAIYTNINKRVVTIKLNKKDALILDGGKLKVRYTTQDDARKQLIYAEAELEL